MCGNGWDEDEIFGSEHVSGMEEKDVFFNDLQKFSVALNKSWDIAEVKGALKSTFAYIWGKKAEMFVYKEQFLKTANFKQTNICVTGLMPFSKTKSDKFVLVNPTKEGLLKMMRKRKRPRLPKCPKADSASIILEEFKDLTAEYRSALVVYNKCQTLLKLPVKDIQKKAIIEILGDVPPQRQLMSKIFEEYHLEGRLRRYHSYKYTPYLTKDPVRKDQLNCFTGFSLQHFRNRDVDLRKTNLWKWFWVAWCDRREYKLGWIFDYIAHKLQKANKKIKKLLVAYGTQTGTGKTTIRNFLNALADESVLFVDSIGDFTGTYTGQQFGKLWAIIDDIEKWDKASSSKLKTRITSNTYTHRVMYTDPIEMPCYLDLICTANSRTPVYIGRDDRRTEMVKINEELKAHDATSTKFWTDLYAELEDTKIMGAWFEFFATRDISDVVFNEGYRFSEQALAEQKMQNLKSAYHFLVDYFTEDDCIFHRDIMYKSPELFKYCRFKETAEHGRTMLITNGKMFEVFYTRWIKKTNQQKTIKYATFVKDLDELGVIGRWVIHPKESKKKAIRISRKILEDKLASYFKLPSFVIEDLVFETDQWNDFLGGGFPSQFC